MVPNSEPPSMEIDIVISLVSFLMGKSLYQVFCISNITIPSVEFKLMLSLEKNLC